MEPIIDIQHVSKRYSIGGREAYHSLRDSLAGLFDFRSRPASKEFWALQDVNFQIMPGETIGIIGRNGAGKSTLLKILSQITPPTKGKIKMNGRVASLLEVGTGFHPELTGRENIYLNGAILGMTQKEIEAKFDEIVGFAEIEKFLDTPIKRYSSGMYVRLAFAVAAHLEPEILVVDEVLAVGDAQFQEKCLGKMGRVAKDGRTVLFVSHNMTAIRSLCQRAVFLKDGKVIADGPADAVVHTYTSELKKPVLVKEWKRVADAPQNQGAVLEEVALRGHDGEPLSHITTETPFRIDVTYRVTQKDAAVGLTAILYDAENNCVFSSINNHEPAWYGKDMPAGTYTSSCYIPGNLLNEGWFHLSINLFGKAFSDATTASEVLRFEIHDAPSVRGDYFGEWSGVIRPQFNWQTLEVKEK